MLLSLILIQVYGLLPHHHHADNAPAHGQDHSGIGKHAAHGQTLDQPHPDVAPHDEPQVGSIIPAPGFQFDLVLALPPSIHFTIEEQEIDRQRVFVAAEHPYATGPPGTTSSRAPPASLIA